MLRSEKPWPSKRTLLIEENLVVHHIHRVLVLVLVHVRVLVLGLV